MMNRILVALLLAVTGSVVSAKAPSAASQPIELAENAPDRHVVVKGDTLWGISGLFLKNPWMWPQVWNLNKDQIKNPHWIYPGQIVYLDRSGGVPRLRLGQPIKVQPKIYEQTEAEAIPTIPQHVIEPFLIQPLVVDAGWNESAPRLIAIDEQHVAAGTGDKVYVSGVTSDETTWDLYRPARPFVDPETKEVLALEAEHLGSAQLVRIGDPATFVIKTAKREIVRGDRLVPATRPGMVNYVPRAPEATINGVVLAIPGGLREAGRNNVIMLNKGAADGVETGQVLAMYRAGRYIADTRKEFIRDKEVARNEQRDDPYGAQLPDERYGLVFIFRVFDRVSYGLIMNSDRPAAIGDQVSNP